MISIALIISTHGIVFAFFVYRFPLNLVIIVCLLFDNEFIADTPDIHDILWYIRRNFELVPQMAH